MSATNRVAPFELWPDGPAEEARESAAGPQLISVALRVPALRLAPLLRPEQPEYPRASLHLPLRLRGAGGVPEEFPITLVTRNISSTGVYFLCPKQIAIGTSIELEIVLVSKPLGLGNVVAATMARVCRTETAAMPGWQGIAAAFDDVQFDRDDCIPSRYLKP